MQQCLGKKVAMDMQGSCQVTFGSKTKWTEKRTHRFDLHRVAALKVKVWCQVIHAFVR